MRDSRYVRLPTVAETVLVSPRPEMFSEAAAMIVTDSRPRCTGARRRPTCVRFCVVSPFSCVLITRVLPQAAAASGGAGPKNKVWQWTMTTSSKNLELYNPLFLADSLLLNF
jgi:hypothetical protein